MESGSTHQAGAATSSSHVDCAGVRDGRREEMDDSTPASAAGAKAGDKHNAIGAISAAGPKRPEVRHAPGGCKHDDASAATTSGGVWRTASRRRNGSVVQDGRMCQNDE